MLKESPAPVTENDVLDSEYPVTDDQIASLHEKSWALLPGLLDTNSTERIRAVLSRAKVRDKGKFLDLSEADQKASMGGANTMGGGGKNELFSHENTVASEPDLLHVAISKRLSGAIVKLMKLPDAIFTQDVSFIKPPGASEVPLHQDHSYFPFDRQGCLTIWIALVDLPEESGPLHYLEGSHLAGPLGFKDQADVRDVYPQLRNNKKVGGKTLKAGDAQVHWDLTLHGSAPNMSQVTREAMAFRYVRSDTVYNGVAHAHYDKLNLPVGERFANMGQFWRIGPDGILK